jgi:hypothetical protein
VHKGHFISHILNNKSDVIKAKNAYVKSGLRIMNDDILSREYVSFCLKLSPN